MSAYCQGNWACDLRPGVTWNSWRFEGAVMSSQHFCSLQPQSVAAGRHWHWFHYSLRPLLMESNPDLSWCTQEGKHQIVSAARWDDLPKFICETTKISCNMKRWLCEFMLIICRTRSSVSLHKKRTNNDNTYVTHGCKCVAAYMCAHTRMCPGTENSAYLILFRTSTPLRGNGCIWTRIKWTRQCRSD